MDKWIVDKQENKMVFAEVDPAGVTVKLYNEQWEHIKKRHPEIKPVSKVRATVKEPDIIQSNEDRDARIYTAVSSTNSYFNVFAGIISETECKVRTSYITRDLPEGDCIWQRQKK